MTFDIHQRVFDSDGLPREKIAVRYREQLVQLFAQSPEAQALTEQKFQIGNHADAMIDFGLNYLSLTPPGMSADDLAEVVFELFPRKLSIPPETGPEIIRELRAFWQFLQREFQLKNAEACLDLLNEDAEKELEKELSNPANYGIAKSFVMQALAEDVDITSDEDVQRFVEEYNARLAKSSNDPLSGMFPPPSLRSATLSNSFNRGGAKPKRKAVKASRKKSRRKK